MLFHIAGGRLGQQGTQVRFRDQHVGGAPAARPQAVAQHVEEDAGRGSLGRRIQCGQAQRVPHQPVQAVRLVEALQQFGHRAIVVQLPAHRPHGGGKAHQGQLVGALQTFGAQQGPGQVQRCGQARRQKIHAIGVRRIAHLQGQGEDQLGRVLARELDQAQGFRVRAQQDVLAVVEHGLFPFDAARAAAQGARRLEHGHRVAGARQFHGRRAAGPAGADDGVALLHVTLSHEPRSSRPATVCGSA